MSKLEIGQKVCFVTCPIEEFFGGVYEVCGWSMYGMLYDVVCIKDGCNVRKIFEQYLRPATETEILNNKREST